MVFGEPVLRAEVLPAVVALEVVSVVAHQGFRAKVASPGTRRDLWLVELCAAVAAIGCSLLNLFAAVLTDSLTCITQGGKLTTHSGKSGIRVIWVR